MYQHKFEGSVLELGHTKFCARPERWSIDPIGVATSNLPLVLQAFLDFLPVLGHQPLGTPPSNRVDHDGVITVLGCPVEPPTM